TGGYAVRAHRLVNRPSQDLDVATENPAPMADIAATLRAGLEARGWKVHALETAPLSARFTVTDPATGQECEVDILKEIFWRPVAQSPYGPVLAEEDVIGTKVRALADRGAPRDLLDGVPAPPAVGPGRPRTGRPPPRPRRLRARGCAVGRHGRRVARRWCLCRVGARARHHHRSPLLGRGVGRPPRDPSPRRVR